MPRRIQTPPAPSRDALLPSRTDAEHDSMLAIRIPSDLHVELRVLAARRRSNLRELVLDLLRREVAPP